MSSGEQVARPSRSTRQGAAVEDALGRAADFRTAQELHVRLRADGHRVGLTTVYRHLQRLVDAGEVDTVRVANGEVAYRRCREQGHHHHLVCRHCGRTVEVDGPDMEAWLDRVATKAGFSEIVHTVEIVGRCRACAREQQRSQRG